MGRQTGVGVRWIMNVPFQHDGQSVKECSRGVRWPGGGGTGDLSK